jgi:ligand-binding SRPBCC domain-containing protein
MNVIPIHVILMPHASTLWDHTHVFAKLDTLEMEHTVKTSMNAVYHHHATQMALVLITRDPILVGAILDILETELIVMI